MDFLKRLLGINTTYCDESKPSFPNYIESRYSMRFVYLDKTKSIFVYPNTNLDSISSIKNHFDYIRNETNSYPILVLEHLSSRDKQYLLKNRIPFIVENKQIYLPFLALYLSERGDSDKYSKEKLLPSSQLLLLYYIYHECGELMTSVAVQDLGFTPMSISRASRQLEDLGLVQTIKRGVQKIIYSSKKPHELFDDAKSYFVNPIKRTIYISKEKYDKHFMLSSYSALAYYSNINSPKLEYYAIDSISKYEKEASNKVLDNNEQIALELWRYNPHKLSSNQYVDRLSLVLSLMNNKDERIEQSIEIILNNLWDEIDG